MSDGCASGATLNKLLFIETELLYILYGCDKLSYLKVGSRVKVGSLESGIDKMSLFKWLCLGAEVVKSG